MASKVMQLLRKIIKSRDDETIVSSLNEFTKFISDNNIFSKVNKPLDKLNCEPGLASDENFNFDECLINNKLYEEYINLINDYTHIINNILFGSDGKLFEINFDQLLQNKKFVEAYTNFVKNLVYFYTLRYVFIDQMINKLVSKLNNMTKNNYIIYKCRPDAKYTCGRSVTNIDTNDGNHILISNTVSEYDSSVDTDYIQSLLLSKGGSSGIFYQHLARGSVKHYVASLKFLMDPKRRENMPRHYNSTMRKITFSHDPNWKTNIPYKNNHSNYLLDENQKYVVHEIDQFIYGILEEFANNMDDFRKNSGENVYQKILEDKSNRDTFGNDAVIALKELLYPFLQKILNPLPRVAEYIKLLNKGLGMEYFILDCDKKNPEYNYTCGRAIAYISDNKTGHVYFFDTESTTSDYENTEHLAQLLEQSEDKPEQSGGYYRQKYLIYKKKYLQLKKKN